MNKKIPTVELQLQSTLLKVVRASVGTPMFQTLYADVDGRRRDVTKRGDLSCAFYVSGILSMFGLLDEVHGTVGGTVATMKEFGWRQTRQLKPGSVLVWDQPPDGSHYHRHIGFYIGNGQAVSNSPDRRVPVRHHYTFGRPGGKKHRPVRAIYTHLELK